MTLCLTFMALGEERERREKEPFDVYGVEALSSVFIRMIVGEGVSTNTL